MGFHRVIAAFDGSPQSHDALALSLRLRDPADGLLTLACVVTGQRRHAGAHGRRPEATVPEDIALMFADARAVAIAPGGLRTTDDFRHVGVAYDGSAEARAALSAGYDVAARCGAAMTILYALPTIDPEPVRRELRAQANAALDAAADAAPAGVNPRTTLLHGVPGDVIPDACEGVVDLLVTGSRGYGPMHRAMLGSVSEELTDGAPYPTLVVPRGSGAAPGDPMAVAETLEVR
jgi:nucleotide-binding universal stress UspA family protein